ncbi:MAG: carboxypeptidase-like regulatory domain-containing protein [Gemmatimonadetes bacterium]|nr:carboxypeptidase-like regulatory domain-containing protein [Gemmatimonadota bacterium]
MIRRSFVLMALVLAGGQAQAQVPDRIIAGVVFDSVSGEPVSNATIYIQGRRDEFSTDSYGRFKIRSLHRQDTLLVIRRIGYVPGTVVFPYSPDKLVLDVGAVRLRAVATRLDQIAVEVEEVNRYPQLTDFYRRKQANRPGLFITREDIARTSARKASEMLRRTSKLEMDCVQQVLSSDACIARSRRGRNVVRMFNDAATNRARQSGVGDLADTAEIVANQDRCEMDIFVDGMKSSLPIDEIPLTWIAGMEVYNGLAQTPPQFGHGACGVIAIWTTRAGG